MTIDQSCSALVQITVNQCAKKKSEYDPLMFWISLFWAGATNAVAYFCNWISVQNEISINWSCAGDSWCVMNDRGDESNKDSR